MIDSDGSTMADDSDAFCRAGDTGLSGGFASSIGSDARGSGGDNRGCVWLAVRSEAGGDGDKEGNGDGGKGGSDSRVMAGTEES